MGRWLWSKSLYSVPRLRAAIEVLFYIMVLLFTKPHVTFANAIAEPCTCVPT